MNSPIEEYLTAEKAAAILDVTPQMIRKLCRLGKLPFYKVGRCIRISRPDFENYLAKRRIAGQSTAETANRSKLACLQHSIVKGAV